MSAPPEDALFQIEVPDEDGCVWACSLKGRSIWCHNLVRRIRSRRSYTAGLHRRIATKELVSTGRRAPRITWP